MALLNPEQASPFPKASFGNPPLDIVPDIIDHLPMKTRFSLLRRHLGLLALSLALACLSLVGNVRADDAPPTFSDPDVTAFIKSYGEFADHYSANMKDYMAAVKSGDAAKMQAGATKMQADTTKSAEIQTKASAMTGKIKPDEVQKFSGYLQKCAQKMADAAKPQ